AAVLLLGDGSYSVYTKSGAGPWTPPPGETARLVRQTTLLAGARWVLYLNGGASVGYRDDGWQVWTRDLLGNQTTYAYDDTRLISISDPTGRSFQFNYTSGGHVASVDVKSSPGATPVRAATLVYSGCSGPAPDPVICRLVKFIVHTSSTTADTTQYAYTVDGAQRVTLASMTAPRVHGGSHPVTQFAYDTMTRTPTDILLPGGLAVIKYRG